MNAKVKFLAANLRPGELYAGLMLDVDGRDYHLILLSYEAASVTWEEAQQWAKERSGSLPTRREFSLLYANLKGEFKPDWYWSDKQHAAFDNFAWSQSFGFDHQLNHDKSKRLRARFVRRIYIEQEGE